MDLYLFCLCLSFAGLVLMALLGLGHHHTGHGHGHFHARGGGRTSGQRSGSREGGLRPGRALFLLGLLSPRVLFSMLMGFGAAGMLLHTLTALAPVPLLALAGIAAVAFEYWIVGPFWALLFGFASKPARTLESVLFEAGKAATDFDRNGHGLVLLELDGQVRQILGTLAPEERIPDAPRIRTGERLFIRSVDHRRNVCTVSRLGC